MSHSERIHVVRDCLSSMKLISEFRKWGFVVAVFSVLSGYAAILPAAEIELTPASFEEEVGVYYFDWAFGESNLVAESVVQNLTGGWGDAMGWSITSNILPGTAEAGVVLHGSGSAGWGATAYAITVYQYAVVPSNPLEELPDVVPVIFSTSGSVDVATDLSSIGETFSRIDYPGGQFQASNCDAYGCYEGNFSFNESVTLQTPVNTAQGVTMYVRTHAESNTNFQFSSRAVADPYIMIDPAFQYYDKFKIVYSAGIIPNVIPEPGSFFLMAVGLIPLLGRHRRSMKNRV